MTGPAGADTVAVLSYGHMRQAVRAVIVHDGALLVMRRNKFGREYYTLVGGGVEAGEELEVALMRELSEETTLRARDPKLVFIEEADEPFGTQYIYHCEYDGGDIALRDDSEEAQSNQGGMNTYHPEWLPTDRLKAVAFMSPDLQERLIGCLTDGAWPDRAERFIPAKAAGAAPAVDPDIV